MKTPVPFLLTALIILTGIVGCDSKSDFTPGRREISPAPQYQPLPRVKTEADYVQDVIDTITIYKQNLNKSASRSAQQLESRNSNDFVSVMQGIGDIQKMSEDTVSYARMLNQLDVSNCPADFRACYAAYVERIAILANSFHQSTHLDENGELGGTFFSMIGLAINGEQYTQDVRDAEEALYQLAQNKYGATIPN